MAPRVRTIINKEFYRTKSTTEIYISSATKGRGFRNTGFGLGPRRRLHNIVSNNNKGIGLRLHVSSNTGLFLALLLI